MALFHFTVTQTKRSKGQSAIASAAYRSGEKLYSEYYGEYSDYTRKGGVICSDILLPPHALKEYADRQTLWNAVEKAERGKNAQLAYSFEISLQNEFSLEENIALAREFLFREFVSRGMTVDVSFHEKECEDGGTPNPHFHFLCPIRPMEQDGTWGIKQRREYVLDEEGNPVAPGQPGALHTRGPYTFRGYYQSPTHNARVFDADGFYCSGDLVVQDADGYLTVVGRQKDQINRGGEKIAAEEVENQLLHHPAITQAALVSMPDSAMGEKSCAFIVSTDPALKPLALRKFLRERGVADFKLPDRFETLDALPMTAVGKIDKQGLRARIAYLIAANQSLTTA